MNATEKQYRDAYAAKLREARGRKQTSEATKLALLVVAFAVILLLVSAWTLPRQADAAPRPAFKGTVTIVVSNTTKSDPYGQYLNTKLWNLPAAAKAAGIGKYRIVTTKYANDPNVWGDVYVRSIKSQAKVADVYKLIDSGEIWESQVTMSDSRGAKLTAAQRHNELVKALKAATPR